MPQQRQSPGLSTDAGQGFQTAATPQLDGPSSDIPRQDEVIGSLREELTTRRREVDALQAQKTTLEGAISGKDKELGDLRDRQRSSSEDLENARKELQSLMCLPSGLPVYSVANRPRFGCYLQVRMCYQLHRGS
jgi:hypothetical protein